MNSASEMVGVMPSHLCLRTAQRTESSLSFRSERSCASSVERPQAGRPVMRIASIIRSGQVLRQSGIRLWWILALSLIRFYQVLVVGWLHKHFLLVQKFRSTKAFFGYVWIAASCSVSHSLSLGPSTTHDKAEPVLCCFVAYIYACMISCQIAPQFDGQALSVLSDCLTIDLQTSNMMSRDWIQHGNCALSDKLVHLQLKLVGLLQAFASDWLQQKIDTT